MLDFDQELKKFKPCMDISDVEDEAGADLSDVLDFMRRRNGGSSRERRKEGSYDSRRK